MAVIMQKGGGGLLGNLGTLATLGGTIIPGMQWLTPLGLGMNAVNGMMNGSGVDANTAGAILNGVINGSWLNPASGSIAKVSNAVSKAANGITPMKSDRELMRTWNIYNR